MAYTANIPANRMTAADKEHIIFKEHASGPCRSPSLEDLRKQTKIRRSYSDNHLHRTHIRASGQSRLKSSCSTGKFPIHLSSDTLPTPIRPLFLESEANTEMKLAEGVTEEEVDQKEKVNKTNWVQKLMELRAHWKDRQGKEARGTDRDQDGSTLDDEDEGVCAVDYDEEDERRTETSFDSKSFSRFLHQVSWSDAKRFSQLAHLCKMAYMILDIKPHDLRYYGLQYITSSLEKKQEAAALTEELNRDSTKLPAAGYRVNSRACSIHPSVAYEIAASAASHVQSQANGTSSSIYGSIDQLREQEIYSATQMSSSEYKTQMCESEMAAYMATSTMTAVVAAREKEKQKAAEELKSLHSSPCDWFICDDTARYTRHFIIQGSECLASWQANLLFEPTAFEGTDVLVHRGIYEAAKGIYEQFLPEIQSHLSAYGDGAKLQFTGHSLGGSLSLLVQLMLVARKIVKPTSLLPVVTFGSPFVLCGGHKILSKLGLDESQFQCVVLHRDIVPRAFSCKYPKHVAHILKSLNGSFKSHPCLNKHELLYTPLGQIFILQPDERLSQSHPLLPPGNALYALNKSQSHTAAIALKAFLNTPHPLETLSDPRAYGSEGTIIRDHDSSTYLKAVNGVLRQYTKMVVRRVRKERHFMWSSMTSPSNHRWSPEGSIQGLPMSREIPTGV